jgi:hypothetical protein
MFKVGRLTGAFALALGVTVMTASSAVASASAASGPGIVATYNGGTLDLSQGWGSAAICAVTNLGTSCFSKQSEYQTWFSSQPQLVAESFSASSGNCSTGLKMFQKVNYGGTELVIFEKSEWINLSAYSFADELSSYQVGACAADMAAGTNGSGAAYPGNTSPGADVTTLGSSWNDRMQSVYII